ncbi:MAG: J domain-containing protein [Candidatus Gastranaerophilaceae bacterium]
MKDIKKLLKSAVNTAVDKIKSVTEKEEIPLSEAFEQMDKELEEAIKAYGKPLFPEEDEAYSPEEYYLKILGFEEIPTLDNLKSRYEKLLLKLNPENFADNPKKQTAAVKRIDNINKAYKYFEHKLSEEL